ncbi:MAG: hypothetical protein ACRDK8_11620 [Solirubrobacteraceae bacterium]
MSAVVVVGLAIVNSAGPPATAPVSFGVNLGGPSQLGTENAHLAQIGARLRVVPLLSSCRPGSGSRPRHVSGGEALDARVPWVRGVWATQAPAGETRIVLLSRHGLADVSFLVHGSAPACVPVIGVVPYWR